MQEEKKILMLGGTGAMGVYLAPEMIKLGYHVYLTSRKEHKSTENITYITGNAKDKSFLDTLLKQRYDCIVDFMIYKTEEFRERYLDLLNSTAHYVFLSSYRVYGDNHGAPITEESPRLLDSVQDEEYLATDEYGLTKARQENILRASGRNNWTIIRPAITYSKDRFQLGTMEAQDFVKRALEGKTVIIPEQMLEKQATLSWAGDVAKMMSRIILNEKAMGEVYTVSTAEHHTWKEIMELYIELLGMHVKIVDLSVYQSVFGGPYQIKYDRMLDRVVDNSKVLEVTGMSQEELLPLKDGLRMELNNFVNNPTYRAFNAGRDKKLDALVADDTKDTTKSLVKPTNGPLETEKSAYKCGIMALIRRVNDFFCKRGSK
ncbi:NAD-dependent epimerase/dehydratase family protein [Anaeromassilibacillus senegalensis]|uniref:UDP-glucose 4-epimerase n=1 Tax=Anaeromassilibacillus senegalensis TaxID=1673717 RepID=A0ABS9CRC6_9FIRM|nr:NAD-dependent epimerase/dehydratase family protein [Anaeromassilibacillus senegalensis]MCF2653183.1 NAD-dependent epimerase/dehydratase family protein [Anaeromassilibacillus senegalensis]